MPRNHTSRYTAVGPLYSITKTPAATYYSCPTPSRTIASAAILLLLRHDTPRHRTSKLYHCRTTLQQQHKCTGGCTATPHSVPYPSSEQTLFSVCARYAASNCAFVYILKLGLCLNLTVPWVHSHTTVPWVHSHTSMFVVARLLRGTIVNRTYGTRKNLYISLFLLTNLVLFTMVLRNSVFLALQAVVMSYPCYIIVIPARKQMHQLSLHKTFLLIGLPIWLRACVLSPPPVDRYGPVGFPVRARPGKKMLRSRCRALTR